MDTHFEKIKEARKRGHGFHSRDIPEDNYESTMVFYKVMKNIVDTINSMPIYRDDENHQEIIKQAGLAANKLEKLREGVKS